MTVTMETTHLWLLDHNWCKPVSVHVNLLLCFQSRRRAHWGHSASLKHIWDPLILLHPTQKDPCFTSTLWINQTDSFSARFPQQKPNQTGPTAADVSRCDLPQIPVRPASPSSAESFHSFSEKSGAYALTYVCSWNSWSSWSSISAVLTIRTLEAQVQPTLKRKI